MDDGLAGRPHRRDRRAHARGVALGTLRKLVELIPDRFEYRRGVTFVGSTVDDLLESGAGVCQDFAHLALLALRRNGLAARYVSGYLFAPTEGDESADSAESTPTPGSRRCCPSRRTAASRAGSGSTRPTAC